MANQRINEAGRLIDQLRDIDRQFELVTEARSDRCNQINIGPYVFDRDLSQMILGIALNHLAERRANIVERLENEYKLRDTA